MKYQYEKYIFSKIFFVKFFIYEITSIYIKITDMKKTLQEEKERITRLMKVITEQSFNDDEDNDDEDNDDEDNDVNPDSGVHQDDYELQSEFRSKLQELVDDYVHTLAYQGIVEAMEDVMSGLKNGDEDPEVTNATKRFNDMERRDSYQPPKPQATNEYEKTYDKNMSQGFSPINESVIFNGKSYKLTITKKKNSVMKRS